MAKLPKLLALSPTYQLGKKLGLFDKDKKKKAKASNTTTKQTDVGQNQAQKMVGGGGSGKGKYSASDKEKIRKAGPAVLGALPFKRGGLVSKSGIMHGYKKGGQV